MSAGIEARLEGARKARQERINFKAVPTVGDVLLEALDALPEHERLGKISEWARHDGQDTIGALRRQVALGWLTGPKK